MMKADDMIDINIDSDNDEKIVESKLRDDNRKFLFNFRKTVKKKSESSPNESQIGQIGGGDESNRSSIKVESSPKDSPKTRCYSQRSIDLNQAADILLSNLNEMNLSSHTEDDDDDDDEEDGQETPAPPKSRRSLFQGSKQKFFNSTVVSTINNSLNSSKMSINGGDNDEGCLFSNNHSTPLPSDYSSLIDDADDEKLDKTLNLSVNSSNENDSTLSEMKSPNNNHLFKVKLNETIELTGHSKKAIQSQNEFISR